MVALTVDDVREVPPQAGAPARGVARLCSGLLLIFEPDRFLTADETDVLDAALAEVDGAGAALVGGSTRA